MATLSFRLLPPIRAHNFRPISASSSNGAPLSKQRSGGPVIMEIPLEKIKRPLMMTRSNDPNKVQELMDSIKVIGLQVPGFRVVTGTRLTNVSVYQLFGARYDVAQKRH